jgi:hypothetical protein
VTRYARRSPRFLDGDRGDREPSPERCGDEREGRAPAPAHPGGPPVPAGLARRGPLAAAVAVLFESSHDQDVTLVEIWDASGDVVPRGELRAALESIAALAPAPDIDPGGAWRAVLVERYAVVQKFLGLRCRTVGVGATAQAAGVLEALLDLPGLMHAPVEHGDLVSVITSAAWLAAERARLAQQRGLTLPGASWATTAAITDDRGASLDPAASPVGDALKRGLLALHERGVVVTSAGHEHVLRATVS